MSENTEPNTESQGGDDSTKVKGRGHTVERTINGRKVQVPWGFTDYRTEGKAAKAVGINYPGTSRKEDK